MFAGIASVMLNEEGTIINGIASREGKHIFLRKFNLYVLVLLKTFFFSQK